MPNKNAESPPNLLPYGWKMSQQWKPEKRPTKARLTPAQPLRGIKTMSDYIFTLNYLKEKAEREHNEHETRIYNDLIKLEQERREKANR